MRKILFNFGGLLLCLFGTVNCSRLDIAVHWADTYIISKVDDYFDLSSQQKKDLKDLLKKDILKIRKELFLEWAGELRRIKKYLSGTPGSGTRANLQKEFHNSFVKSLEVSQEVPPYLTNTALRLVATASPAQLERFEKTVRKKDIEDKKQVQDSEKARNESRKKYLRWIEMWIGSLSKEQTQLLNQHLSQHPFPLQTQLNNKTYVLEKFHEARKSPETLKTFIHDYYNRKYEIDNPEYRQALKAYQNELEKFIFRLVLSLDEKQKKLLADNLSEKSAALEKLSVIH